MAIFNEFAFGLLLLVIEDIETVAVGSELLTFLRGTGGDLSRVDKAAISSFIEENNQKH